VVVRWENSTAPFWAKIPASLLPHNWDESGVLLEELKGNEDKELVTLCCSDPASKDLFVILADESNESPQHSTALQPITLRLGIRSDSAYQYSEALTAAIQGIIAIMTQGEKWGLHAVLACASEVLRSVHQARTTHKIHPPSREVLALIQESLQNVLKYVSQSAMHVFLDLLRACDIDLGNLYGPGILQQDELCNQRQCPICSVICWERVRSIHGGKDVRLVELQCAICGVVCEAPTFVVVDRVDIEPSNTSILVSISFRNIANFPVALSFKWHAEANSAPGKLTYSSLDQEFDTKILKARDTLKVAYEPAENFLRVLHLYFTANGYVGFVQIKDAEPCRNRRKINSK
jgi:hypothetical protein